MKIIWTDEAVADLEDIFYYYVSEANHKVALKIVEHILESADRLENHPKSGQKEALLKDRGLEYRYIVTGNYKIIYWIEAEAINVVSVFDCRQNPTKMESI